MAYLLLITTGNSPHEAWDVISWRDENMNTQDGSHGFGTKTLQDERFKVVHIPDMSNNEANELCRQQAEYTDQPANNRLGIPEKPRNPDAKIRAYTFNIDKLSSQKRGDVTRKNKTKNKRFSVNTDGSVQMLDVKNLEITNTEFLVAKELKPYIDNREGAVPREIT